MQDLMTFLAFLCLTASFLSLWLTKEKKIWFSLISLSWIFGILAGHIQLAGCLTIFLLTSLFLAYEKKQSVLLFFILIFFCMGIKLRFFQGFSPYVITDRFRIGLENPLIGLFPLALFIPLAKTKEDFRSVLKGLAVGMIGISFIAFLVIFFKVIPLNFKIPPHMALRTFSNLILTSIPEEAFYRGFLQNQFEKYLKQIPFGKTLSLILSSSIFTFAHIYWSPNIAILAFTFVASLLYGTVYLYSKRIESAILTHFLLNLVHMSLFSYHAI